MSPIMRAETRSRRERPEPFSKTSGAVGMPERASRLRTAASGFCRALSAAARSPRVRNTVRAMMLLECLFMSASTSRRGLERMRASVRAWGGTGPTARPSEMLLPPCRHWLMKLRRAKSCASNMLTYTSLPRQEDGALPYTVRMPFSYLPQTNLAGLGQGAAEAVKDARLSSGISGSGGLVCTVSAPPPSRPMVRPTTL